jgi:phage terminase large subunit-like protein
MWNITQKFGRYRSKLDEYRQDIRNMSVPTKELESMILQRRVTFGLDPVIRWMIGNVALYVDPNANVKLNKARSRNKIDGVVALVNAIGGYLSSTAKPAAKELYTDHSLRVIRI